MRGLALPLQMNARYTHSLRHACALVHCTIWRTLQPRVPAPLVGTARSKPAGTPDSTGARGVSSAADTAPHATPGHALHRTWMGPPDGRHVALKDGHVKPALQQANGQHKAADAGTRDDDLERRAAAVGGCGRRRRRLGGGDGLGGTGVAAGRHGGGRGGPSRQRGGAAAANGAPGSQHLLLLCRRPTAGVCGFHGLRTQHGRGRRHWLGREAGARAFGARRCAALLTGRFGGAGGLRRPERGGLTLASRASGRFAELLGVTRSCPSWRQFPALSLLAHAPNRHPPPAAPRV